MVSARLPMTCRPRPAAPCLYLYRRAPATKPAYSLQVPPANGLPSPIETRFLPPVPNFIVIGVVLQDGRRCQDHGRPSTASPRRYSASKCTKSSGAWPCAGPRGLRCSQASSRSPAFGQPRPDLQLRDRVPARRSATPTGATLARLDGALRRSTAHPRRRAAARRCAVLAIGLSGLPFGRSSSSSSR